MVMMAALLLSSCGDRVQSDLETIDDASMLDDLHLQIPALDPAGWVERHDAEKAWPGYTLVFYRRRVPMLIDMTGRIVHIWPRVRATARARLGRDGRLLVIGTDNLIKVYEWDGRLSWYFRPPEGYVPHHDVTWLDNGNVLVLTGDERDPRGDLLQEVDRRGRVVWEWSSWDHREAFATWNDKAFYPTHINSIREIPANRWFDRGADTLRPGNILVSARNLDTIFVIDKATGEIAWQHTRRLDRQHEAVMIPRGQPGAGMIVLFNNVLKNRNGYRRSEILVLHPVERSVFWRFRNRNFFSSIAGSQQALPNGNILISSSQGGRVLEITPNHELVWQWTPPYLPMRPERYAHDHCPQLESLGPPGGEAIPSRRRRPHVDQDLHMFAVSGEYRSRRIAGEERQIVRENVSCRELVIPPKPRINLGYGIDLARLKKQSLTARFRFTLRRLETDETTVFFEDTVDSAAEKLWREHWLPVHVRAYERVEFCVDVQTEGTVDPERARRIAVVLNPRIYSGDQPELPAHFYGGPLSPQERAIREQQLRALGYVN
jgi:hypothetical protein